MFSNKFEDVRGVFHAIDRLCNNGAALHMQLFFRGCGGDVALRQYFACATRHRNLADGVNSRAIVGERRVAWRKAIYGLFSDEEMQESQRRVAAGIRMLEEALTTDDSETAKKIGDKLIGLAKNGSLAAIKLIAERTEGRPQKNADDGAKDAGAQLTKEQVQARLVELLAMPELKETVTKALFNSGDKSVQ